MVGLFIARSSWLLLPHMALLLRHAGFGYTLAGVSGWRRIRHRLAIRHTIGAGHTGYTTAATRLQSTTAALTGG